MPPGSSGFVEPGLSFSPEKTQIELASEVAASFGVPLPGGPITSLAKAAPALAPVRAAVQTATASNDFLRMFLSFLDRHALLLASYHCKIGRNAPPTNPDCAKETTRRSGPFPGYYREERSWPCARPGGLRHGSTRSDPVISGLTLAP